MLKAEGLIIKMVYRLKGDQLFAGRFIGKSVEAVTNEIMSQFSINEDAIDEKMYVGEIHAISNELLFELFFKYEKEYSVWKKQQEKTREAVENVKDIRKHLERGSVVDVDAPYFLKRS